MGQFDNFFESVDKISATNKVADENGNLTIPPVPSSFSEKTTPKTVTDELEQIKSQEPSEKYGAFFETVNTTAGGYLTAEEVARGKAKQAFMEAIELMDSKNVGYWTSDKNLQEVCSKLRPVLNKLVNKL